MNDVEELKRYSGVHAKGLDITDSDRVLRRITHDGAGPGSWAGEWAAEGDRLTVRGEHLEAGRRYLMARFPYVDGAARQDAYEKSLAGFEKWRAGRGVHRLDVDLDGKQIGCWTTGLSATDRRPLLVIMGGHLTLKEQWAPALPVFARMGVAVVATELPGVGENEAPYDADAWRFLSAVLDALADRADVTRTIALAMSFSGHLALRCAMEDRRIRGIITVGAPVHDFFTDEAWRRQLPRVTVDTLAHLTGGEAVEAGRALPAEGLAALDIPVAYVASLRDEVVPRSDPALLARHVRDLRLLEHDDVHGSPSHVEENKLWMAVQLLDMLGVRNLRSRVIGLMYRLARARARGR
ncbi:alpha/beta fold hydrolase [Kitasatospora sp. NPDC056327]|uniref:alpha/beta fold hydrolase n=1 Tax=Kitasatospora sp. NPDC056327 TaxID=3345785 RepID=UPI0035DE3289